MLHFHIIKSGSTFVIDERSLSCSCPIRSLEGRGAGEVKFSKGVSENLSPSPCSDVSGVWGLVLSQAVAVSSPAASLENVSPALGECLPKPLATFSHFPTTYDVSCTLMTSLSVKTITGHQTLFMKCTGMRPAHSNMLTLLQNQKMAAVAFPGPARSTQALSFMFPFCISPKRDICNIWSCCYSVYNLDVFVKKKKKEIN